MIEALMVDVDGVLVTGRPDDGRLWSSKLQQDLGLDPDLLQRRFFAPHWADIIVGKEEIGDRLAAVLSDIAPELQTEDLIAYWFAHDAKLDRELLKELREQRASGRAIALATNQEHRRARYLTETLGLGRHIDRIYYSAAMGVRKPDIGFFRHIERDIGLDAGQIALIDDTAANVEAAKCAGWHAILWTNKDSLATELARLDIATPPKGNRT